MDQERITENRKFGLVVGPVFLVLSAVLYFWRHRTVAPVVFGILGGALVLLGLVAPALLERPHRAWMALAHAMGRVTTAIFLFLVYFLVLTPLGIVLRLVGRDELHRRRRDESSLWMPYPERNRDVRHFERMF